MEGTLGNRVQSDRKGDHLVHGRALKLVVGLVGLALVVLMLMAVTGVIERNAATRIQCGVDASSARWAAVGAVHTPDYESIAAVGSARWSALGAYHASLEARAADAARWAGLGAVYAPDYMVDAAGSARWTALGAAYDARYTARAADAARWTALAAGYPARYEQSHAAGSARYQALAGADGQRGASADAARWQALATQYPAHYEPGHAAASARYQALGEWYLGRVGLAK